MSLFDFILNVAGLLLWINWRSKQFDPLASSQPVSILGALKKTESRGVKPWKLLVGLLLLLLGRAWVYWWIGSPVGWTPKLNLGFVVLAFQNSGFNLGSISLFSLLSFARVLGVYYFWLVTLVLIGRGGAEPDPIQKLLRLQLGASSRWPWPFLALLPVIFVVMFWLGMQPLLAKFGVVAPVHSMTILLRQALLLLLILVLSLKYLLPTLLLAHLILCYVYLGTSPVWEFIGSTSRNVLAPLRRLPLRIAKLDLAPLAGAALILLLLHWVPSMVQARLNHQHLALWPQ